MTISIEQAQKDLPQLIDALTPGNEIVITRNDKPIAQIIPLPPPPPTPVFGGCRGMLTVVGDDDEHLNDFKDYMP
jgi:antitoxin (DNA-binding transcriptional repressor) of toxin-antitoxin stability system